MSFKNVNTRRPRAHKTLLPGTARERHRNIVHGVTTDQLLRIRREREGVRCEPDTGAVGSASAAHRDGAVRSVGKPSVSSMAVQGASGPLISRHWIFSVLATD